MGTIDREKASDNACDARNRGADDVIAEIIATLNIRDGKLSKSPNFTIYACIILSIRSDLSHSAGFSVYRRM